MIFYDEMAQVFFVFFALVIATTAHALPLPGQPVPALIIQGSEGGRTDGAAWNSLEPRGKVLVFYYVDPDERELNDSLYEAIKRQRYPAEKSQSVAIINMHATLIPDFILSAMLKKKQKQYPRTIYVRDRAGVLVKKWGLTDNSSCVTVVDARGCLVYSQFGALTQADISACLQSIWDAVNKNEVPSLSK
jgi:uncharacterized protein